MNACKPRLYSVLKSFKNRAEPARPRSSPLNNKLKCMLSIFRLQGRKKRRQQGCTTAVVHNPCALLGEVKMPTDYNRCGRFAGQPANDVRRSFIDSLPANFASGISKELHHQIFSLPGRTTPARRRLCMTAWSTNPTFKFSANVQWAQSKSAASTIVVSLKELNFQAPK